jgi:hypothetical protein
LSYPIYSNVRVYKLDEYFAKLLILSVPQKPLPDELPVGDCNMNQRPEMRRWLCSQLHYLWKGMGWFLLRRSRVLKRL